MIPKDTTNHAVEKDLYSSEQAACPSSLATTQPHHRTDVAHKAEDLECHAGTTITSGVRLSTPLTASSLATHNASSRDDEQKRAAEARIDKLQEAARSLDVELPRECFGSEKRELEEWNAVQCRWYRERDNKEVKKGKKAVEGKEIPEEK
ncbi:hypothetical protein K469DRAFT_111252 [Zopfia rhizophila CBS 207.26]|uniref:Uncharacterized protein n=1 Tax=Zopfia rhizophila CBS 207.26 TaxID=1314779 RepID=A0A6A6E9P8_9PEZI|nr:hypothetical protein K469DRAFT_111252 [Zopfia rhizophila CBS 207.26]